MAQADLSVLRKDLAAVASAQLPPATCVCLCSCRPWEHCIDNAPCRTYHVLEGVIVYVLSHSPFLGCVHCLSSILETVGRKL